MIKNHIKLNDGNNIPILGFGTWKAESGKVGNAVKSAIEVGYRHIDCAKAYGNESEIGIAFEEIFNSSLLKREELFITSKLWNEDHNPKKILSACQKTLSDLRLEYLDLYLMHWGLAIDPNANMQHDQDGVVKLENVSIQETWNSMEELVDKGLVKSIGVSNFTTPMLLDLLTYAKKKPVMNQIEIHPYNAQLDFVDFCKKKNISITAYSPLGSHGPKENRPIEDKTIIEIAKKYDKTPAQILIRWVSQREVVVLAKSTNTSRIKENFEVLDFELEQDDMERISELNKNQRFVDPLNFWGIPYFN